ncbi:MAG: hypothetical protein KF880_08575 [Ferruginibacter sp.]|nr:hypothetical protein [Ferruginibacter sp.]
MALILYKWLMVLFMPGYLSEKPLHPFYVSVTEVVHQPATGNLEVVCKIFTDDFEHTLRMANPGAKIDLLKNEMQEQMKPLIVSYINTHLKIMVNDRIVPLQFVGYEQEEEGIISYFESVSVPDIQRIQVWCNMLYEYKKEQMNLFHITVHGNRKSFKLNYPDMERTVTFGKN